MTIKLVGADNIAGTNGWSPDYFLLDKFTAVASGNMTEFKVRSGGNCNIKYAVYADSAGSPGSLITAVNTSTALVAGWNTLSFPSTLITANTVYWLAIIVDQNAGNDGVYHAGSGCDRKYKSATFSSFTFPDPAGTGFGTQTDYYDITAGWGEPSGGGGPSRSLACIIG